MCISAPIAMGGHTSCSWCMLHLCLVTPLWTRHVSTPVWVWSCLLASSPIWPCLVTGSAPHSHVQTQEGAWRGCGQHLSTGLVTSLQNLLASFSWPISLMGRTVRLSAQMPCVPLGRKGGFSLVLRVSGKAPCHASHPYAADRVCLEVYSASAAPSAPLLYSRCVTTACLGTCCKSWSALPRALMPFLYPVELWIWWVLCLAPSPRRGLLGPAQSSSPISVVLHISSMRGQ